MSVSVHPQAGMGLPPRPEVDDIDEKFARSLSLELQMDDVEEYPVLSHGHVMQSLKSEDFTFAKTDCERVPGDSSTTFAAYAVRSNPQTPP